MPYMMKNLTSDEWMNFTQLVQTLHYHAHHVLIVMENFFYVLYTEFFVDQVDGARECIFVSFIEAEQIVIPLFAYAYRISDFVH